MCSTSLRRAAIVFSLMPPTGNTLPVSDSSPNNAGIDEKTELRSGRDGPTCHGQVMLDGFLKGQREQSCDQRHTCTGSILYNQHPRSETTRVNSLADFGRCTFWEVNMDQGISEEGIPWIPGHKHNAAGDKQMEQESITFPTESSWRRCEQGWSFLS